MIHKAFFSCAEPNAYIMIIYKCFYKPLRELFPHARKFYEEETMAAKDLEECKLCNRLAIILMKYSLIIFKKVFKQFKKPN